MKIQNSQIKRFIEEPIFKFNIILIYGNAPGQIRYNKNLLINSLGKKNLREEMRLVEFTEKEILRDENKIQNELEINSFFDGPKIIVIENVTDKLKNTIYTVLNTNLVQGETFLILVSENLTLKSSLRKLIEEDKKKAVSIACYKKILKEVEIKKILDEKNLKISEKSCISYLKEISDGGDDTEFERTLEKLELAFLGKSSTISLEEIETIIIGNITQSYFSIIDSLGNGDMGGTLKYFRSYAIGRKNFSEFLAFLSRYYKNILIFKHKMNHKVPYYGSTKRQFDIHTNIWSKEKTEKAINLIFATNMQLRKKSNYGQQVKIERMLMNICSFIN